MVENINNKNDDVDKDIEYDSENENNEEADDSKYVLDDDKYNTKHNIKRIPKYNFVFYNNNLEKGRNITLGIILIMLGVISIIWGLVLSYSESSEEYSSYGGDAYTGIQNASAKAANNINKLGKTICSGLKGILIVSGGVIIVNGITYIYKKN